jgi:hypothetical protein
MDGARYLVRWPPPPPREIVALVLTGGAMVSLCIVAIGATIHRGAITAEESSLLSTALGAAIGAAATYLGQSRPDPPAQIDKREPPADE